MSIASIIVFNSISKVDQNIAQIESEQLHKNIQSKIDQITKRPIGTKETTTLKLPPQTQTICIVDKESYDPLSKPELDAQVQTRPDKNTFLLPQQYSPQELQGFTIDQSPSCFGASNQILDLSFENTVNGVKISGSKPIEQKKCISLSERQPDKIDIVFIGSHYEEVNELSADATAYINNIFNEIEPFKSNQDLFNFYLIPEKVECEISGMINCDNNKLTEMATSCPNDYIILLANRNQIFNAFAPVRSSAIGNIIKVNTADNPLVIAHEMGHSIANLADEYVDDSYYSLPNFHIEERPNCDAYPCDDLNTGQCIKGCSLSSHYRGTKNSLMNNYYKEDGIEFGPVNENAITSELEKYR